MKVLLDISVILQREACTLINQDIGVLFYWLDRLNCVKTIHPATLERFAAMKDISVSETLLTKARQYAVIKNPATLSDDFISTCSMLFKESIDQLGMILLNELHCNRVDILISEDKKTHTAASLLGLSPKVFSINQFLEKATTENPELVDYKVLSIKKEYFAQIDVKSPFFDSFREDYAEFDNWFNRKADEYAYTCKIKGEIIAFLYIKTEDEKENYSDITPVFAKKKRMKIGTLKVISNGFKIGERFLKIIFDNALHSKVEEIYVTLYNKRPEQARLIELLEQWGFRSYGIKITSNEEELVFVKDFSRTQTIDLTDPKKSFPFSSPDSKIFIVPIYPMYHTELFPDSILNTESPLDFSENEPHRNALSKVYISHSRTRNLSPGDLIVFYRTGGLYKGVATTIAIVESLMDNFKDERTFLANCRKRSVFSDEELKSHWNYRLNHRPFIVNFLYTHSLRKRPTLKWLNENGIIPDIQDMPRGFREISRESFLKIVKYSNQK